MYRCPSLLFVSTRVVVYLAREYRISHISLWELVFTFPRNYDPICRISLKRLAMLIWHLSIFVSMFLGGGIKESELSNHILMSHNVLFFIPSLRARSHWMVSACMIFVFYMWLFVQVSDCRLTILLLVWGWTGWDLNPRPPTYPLPMACKAGILPV